jgi:undecaprenyl-diphosphatase
LAAYDPGVTAAMVESRNLPLTWLAQAVTSVGSTVGLILLSAATAGWLAFRRFDPSGAVWVIAVMIAAEVVTRTTKTAVGRARPAPGLQLGPTAVDPSFPSGHTLNSTVFFRLLVVALLTRGTLQTRARSWWCQPPGWWWWSPSASAASTSATTG